MGDTEDVGGPVPETSGYVDLALLDGGSFVGDIGKVHAGVSNAKFRMYNWAFYISHQGRHLLWDLGLDEVRIRVANRSLIWRLTIGPGSLVLYAMGEQVHAGGSQPCRAEKNHRESIGRARRVGRRGRRRFLQVSWYCPLGRDVV